MNKIFFSLIIVFLISACKQEKGLLLSDFIDIEDIEMIQMHDSISGYFLTNEQVEDFKLKLGNLQPAEINNVDTTIYKATVQFKGKSFKLMTSNNGDFLQVDSSWITKNKDTLKTLIFNTKGFFDDFHAEKRIKIYAISGLGADIRVYKELDLAAEIIALEWIDPKEKESIEEYAVRLSEKINVREAFAVMGVSFGGLVATEISKNLNPNYSILLSSVETKDELRSFFKIVGKHDLDDRLPINAFTPPKPLANFMFGAEKKEQLNDILEDSDPHFSKWAIHEMMRWKNETKIHPVLKISGTQDRVIPAPDVKDIHLIEGTGHFMIVDRADEVSRIINNYIFKQQNEKQTNKVQKSKLST